MKWQGRKQSTNVEDRRHETDADRKSMIASERKKINQAKARIKNRRKGDCKLVTKNEGQTYKKVCKTKAYKP